jgi:hypothetical protein
MSYTKAQIRRIFQSGISLGRTDLTIQDADGTDRQPSEEELCDDFFESCLRSAREEKPKKEASFDAAAEIADWIKRGRPKGAGVIEELLDDEQ